MQEENKFERVWFTSLTVVALALMTLGTGCNKGLTNEGSKNVDGNGLPIVAVAPLDSSQGSSIADTLEVNVADGTDGFNVTVRAGEDTPPVDELFFKVEYNPKDIQAKSIIVDKSSGDGTTIELAIESEPGVIEVGIVATNLSDDPAVRAGDALLSFTLVEGATSKDVSSVGDNGLSRPRNLEFKEYDGCWTLSWDYTNPGDHNQDGEVGVADLTPIAINYGKMVNNSWDDPLRHIDGDHNGEINLADITPIAINFTAQVWAYQIEMSEDGVTGFEPVGQYLLEDYNMDFSETVNFTYDFSEDYIEGAWYRVVPFDREFSYGPPSEAISEIGRRVDPIQVESGQNVLIIVNVHDLQSPLQQLNAVRVKFPSGFEYVRKSCNAGSVGGYNDDVDGIWSSFAGAFLWPTDMLFAPKDIGGGYQAIDFNVSTIQNSLNAAPIGYGDLFNFKLEGDGTRELTLEFEIYSDDGLLRTFYTNEDKVDTEFGNKLGFEVF